MSVVYEVRGNRYAIATPAECRAAGVLLPFLATEAIAQSNDWAERALDCFCHPSGPNAAKACDGLLVGPFGDGLPSDLLILNSDATFAERSGNGLTIFARYLLDSGVVVDDAQFELCVHHAGASQTNPLCTTVKVDHSAVPREIWIAMGIPLFPRNARLKPNDSARQPFAVEVPPLVDLSEQWTKSVLVDMGNPHCVTFVGSEVDLPSHSDMVPGGSLFAALRGLAFVRTTDGRPNNWFAAGTNLQWATVVGEDTVVVRIFERGEGPTLSSGTSAVAVACSARQLGLIHVPEVEIVMLGGNARVRFNDCADGSFSAEYCGVAISLGPKTQSLK